LDFFGLVLVAGGRSEVVCPGKKIKPRIRQVVYARLTKPIPGEPGSSLYAVPAPLLAETQLGCKQSNDSDHDYTD
jgi:hypothetical protein